LIHTKLGPGLLESVYEVVLANKLTRAGLKVERQVPVPIEFDGIRFEEGFRADLIVEQAVLVELKSVESLAPVHAKQTWTYLKLAGMRLGLLISFGAPQLKNGIKRLVNLRLCAFARGPRPTTLSPHLYIACCSSPS
jgi:GxxExxY protein